MTNCGIIGQAPVWFPFGYDEQDILCLEVKQTLINSIEELYFNGTRRFYSDLSIGVPLWGAEAVLTLREEYSELELHCLVSDEEQATHWPEAYRDRYFSIHESCTHSILLSHKNSMTPLAPLPIYLETHCGSFLSLHNPAVKCDYSFEQLYTYLMLKQHPIINLYPCDEPPLIC